MPVASRQPTARSPRAMHFWRKFVFSLSLLGIGRRLNTLVQLATSFYHMKGSSQDPLTEYPVHWLSLGSLTETTEETGSRPV